MCGVKLETAETSLKDHGSIEMAAAQCQGTRQLELTITNEVVHVSSIISDVSMHQIQIITIC